MEIQIDLSKNYKYKKEVRWSKFWIYFAITLFWIDGCILVSGALYNHHINFWTIVGMIMMRIIIRMERDNLHRYKTILIISRLSREILAAQFAQASADKIRMRETMRADSCQKGMATLEKKLKNKDDFIEVCHEKISELMKQVRETQESMQACTIMYETWRAEKEKKHHECKVLHCNGQKLKELGNRTLCEQLKLDRKALLSYKRPRVTKKKK